MQRAVFRWSRQCRQQYSEGPDSTDNSITKVQTVQTAVFRRSRQYKEQYSVKRTVVRRFRELKKKKRKRKKDRKKSECAAICAKVVGKSRPL